jgi:glutaredoxin-related protein
MARRSDDADVCAKIVRHLIGGKMEWRHKMTDIVERLRKGKFVGGKWVMQEAADEIERLREALEFYANWGAISVYIDEEIYDDGGDKARAALKEGEG